MIDLGVGHIYYDCCYHRKFDRHGNVINYRIGEMIFDQVEHSSILWLSILGLALPNGWRTEYQPYMIYAVVSR